MSEAPARPASAGVAEASARAPSPAGDPPPIDLGPLFAPRSIAVVGASPRSGIAQVVRDNLRVLGSDTACHFVNPRYETLFDQPCYPSLDALPETPDTVVVALNPLRAAAVVEDAGRAGVRSVVIPGGGVVEGGEAAAAMQREVREIAIRHGIALLGPNCMGVLDLTTTSATYIGDVNPWLPRGGVAGIAQSGSVTDAFIHSGARIGFSRIIGTGSEAVLDTCDFLAQCLDDPATDAVILFLEGFRRPERFLALADRALEMGKPIAVVKVGRSEQAQVAALAHSGALAGETRVTDAALAAAGVIRCQDLDELLETAELFSGISRTGRRVGRGRTGVVTVSTGEASLIADLAPRTGIDLPPVTPAAREVLLGDLPTLGYIGNPLDPWGATDAPTAYAAAFEAFAASGAYDVLVLVHDFPYRSLPSEVETALEVTTPLIAATRDRPSILPVFVSLTSGEPTSEIVAWLREHGGGAPVLRGAVEAFAAIAAVARWEGWRERRLAAGPRRAEWPALARDRTRWGHDRDAPALLAGRALSEVGSLAALEAAGLAVTARAVAGDAEQAAAGADGLGYPVVLKIDAEGLAHKSDVGAVRVGLADAASVQVAAAELMDLPLPAGAVRRGLVVQPQATGLELILGARRDPMMGPVVVVGLGGVLAEALDDIAIGLAPLGAADAEVLLDGLRGARLLAGDRGQPGIDRAAVIDQIVRLGDAMVAHPDWLEVDLNPVFSGPAGTLATDALLVTAEPDA